MADSTISALPNAPTLSLTGQELFVLDQQGSTKNLTLAQLMGYIDTHITLPSFNIGQLTYSDIGILFSAQAQQNNYVQIILQNSSSGPAASADYVVSNDLSSASAYYGDFGMNSSGFSGIGSFGLPNAVYVSSTSGDLVLGTTTNNAIHFVVNGGSLDAASISAAGVFNIPNINITGGNISGVSLTLDSLNNTPIGSITPSTGAFTTLSATGVITSTLATGTAPLSITSTTVVPNLNVSQLLGATWAAPGTIGSTTANSGAFTTLSASGVITSTVSAGTAPFTISSTTLVNNLNANYLGGATFASPGPIGSGTSSSGAFTSLSALSISGAGFTNYLASPPAIGNTAANTGAFTTLSATGVITSTLATGTSPFTISSTTVVPNLNVSQLLGATWAAPGTIGSTTPNTGAFTTLSASSTVSGAGFSAYLASPPAIGNTAPNSGKFTYGWSPNLTLTDAATIAWDTSTGQVATFTFVSTNRTVGAPTNLQNGAFYSLAVIQNAGSNTLTWNSVFKWAGGVAPTLSTGAAARDYFVFRSDGTNLYEQGRALGDA